MGACVRAGTHPKFCASLTPSKSSSSASLQRFLSSAFSISPTAMTCSLKAADSVASEDSDVARTLFSHNSSESDLSRTYGATLTGAFRNLQYFHPHSTRMLYEMISKLGCFVTGGEKVCLPPKLSVDDDDICLSLSAFSFVNASPNNFPAQKSLIGYYTTAIDHFTKTRKNSKVLVVVEVSSSKSPLEERKMSVSIYDGILRYYRMMNSTATFLLLWNFSFIESLAPHLYSLTSIRQLAGCTNIIASNSSQSWWSAYLASQVRYAQVVVPQLSKSNNPAYLPTWKALP
jgi:hypothetical protein